VKKSKAGKEIANLLLLTIPTIQTLMTISTSSHTSEAGNVSEGDSDMQLTDNDPNTRIVPISSTEFLQDVFAGACPTDFIAFGHAGKSHPMPLGLASVSDWRSQRTAILAGTENSSAYLCYQTLGVECLKKRSSQWTGSPLFFHKKNKYVREQCAIVVDLDIGRDRDEPPGAALPAAEGLKQIFLLCDLGKLPEPSLVIASGQGLQLVWLLREAGNENVMERRPVLADDQTKASRLQITDELLARIKPIRVDTGASKSLSQWFRLPGSINEKNGARVEAYRVGVAPRYYALDELCASLLISGSREESPRLFEDAEKVYGRKRASKRTGTRKRDLSPAQCNRPNEVRISELQRINRYRGGIQAGHRYSFVLHLHPAVRRRELILGRSKEEAGLIADTTVSEEVSLFDQSGHQFTREDWQSATDSDTWIVASNETVAEQLDVTPEEVEQPGLTSIVPPVIARQRKRQEEARKNQRRIEQEVRNLRIYVLADAGMSRRRIGEVLGVTESVIRTAQKNRPGNRTYVPSDSPLGGQEHVYIQNLMSEIGLDCLSEESEYSDAAVA
jgi:hypothetical protein